jgi:hypothetical protein
MTLNYFTLFVIQLESQEFIMIIDKSIYNRDSNSQGIKRGRRPRLTTENLNVIEYRSVPYSALYVKVIAGI